MSEQTLPGIDASSAAPASPRIPPDPPRLLYAERRQIRLLPMDLESRLAVDHPARSIWTLVEKLDLSAFENSIKSRGEGAGRPAIDPRILVTLWVFATSEGVGSARELEELCGAHDAYRWICGGVPVCAHTLSDFRVAHPKALDDLLTHILAVLRNQGLVELKRVAQDGMRVRASAGAASFRREPSLKKCLDEARRQVEEVAREAGDGSCERRKASRRRAAEDRLKRVERALELLPEVQKVKKVGDKPNARVSTTDPEARVMKMGDGGYVDHEDIVRIAARQITPFLPLPKPRSGDADPHQPKPDDPPGIADWRRRMATPEAKEIYKQRAATAETSNANLKCLKGLDRFTVRTVPKVRCVVLWAVIAYDLLRWISMT